MHGFGIQRSLMAWHYRHFWHSIILPCCICRASSVPALPQLVNALAYRWAQLPLQKLSAIPVCALTKKAPLVMITYNNLNIHVHELTIADPNAAVQSLITSCGTLQPAGILCAWADATSMQTREKAVAGSIFILVLQTEGNIIDIIEVINNSHYYNYARCKYKPLRTIELYWAWA